MKEVHVERERHVPNGDRLQELKWMFSTSGKATLEKSCHELLDLIVANRRRQKQINIECAWVYSMRKLIQ